MKKKIVILMATVFLTAGLALADSGTTQPNSQKVSAPASNPQAQKGNSSGQLGNMNIGGGDSEEMSDTVMLESSKNEDSDLKQQMDQMKKNKGRKHKTGNSVDSAKSKTNRTPSADLSESVTVSSASKGKTTLSKNGAVHFSSLKGGSKTGLGDKKNKPLLNPQPLPPGMKPPGSGGTGAAGFGTSSSK